MNGRDECVLARQVIAEADADKKNTQKELNSLIKDLKVHIDYIQYTAYCMLMPSAEGFDGWSSGPTDTNACTAGGGVGWGAGEAFCGR
jgi:hypothetical protein